MFDSQKISFDSFVTGYKHGVYIITRDACEVCQEYKRDIEYINNRYLYFVEARTEAQLRIAKGMHDRLAFPMTAGWKDNQLVFVRLGELFGKDFSDVLDWLKQFGDAPLSESELKERIDKFNARCELSFYIFPDDMCQEQRNKFISSAYDRHELPVDVDTICPMLDMEKRVNMILSYNARANYILYGTDGRFCPFKVSILSDYMKLNGHPVLVREINGHS